MITITNFKDVLKTLEFEIEGNTYKKSIGETTLFGETTLKVDFEKKEIFYPEEQGLKIHERQPCNFSHPENFIVFECVHRLLKKGYKPEHLELEPKWKLGRGASGGRADILVRDHENNPLLLIECKTAGKEFERAWRKTLQNGDQLFSYAQQIPQTQYLCLYASDFVKNEICIHQRIIAHRDNEKILIQNESLQPFAEATDVEDRYDVWRDTYELEYTESGIFEENILAYQIGKNKYTFENDTKPIVATDVDTTERKGKYDEFRTTLRKYNIARREQAFEVLVNLFLCKLVDEEDNKTDLQFSWKGIAYDNYFDYIDRLQNLYRTGMNKFLGKEISYISNEQIDSAFWAVKNDRNATKKKIQEYFRELKFFTNSAFSLLDTHNEELFKRNAKILLEIVQRWQRIRLKTDTQNPFLSELFELFLDDGVKQSEGQFFTPLPVCKFIIGSLPLAQKIEEKVEPLKVIDYACGSGHFLNEYAHQIKRIYEKKEIDREIDLNDYYSHITGIENEDRLAKVAKVTAYMHGQDQIKILDANALASHPEIRWESYDVLVANPPFAVKEFLDTLSKEDKKQYQLIQATGEDSDTNTIQCFFLERIHHLMAPGGVVGVIVPPGILSTENKVHIRTREILLQFFDLVSIVTLGKKTFGKTDTRTVVLFLRRKVERPEPAGQYYNRVKNFFEGDEEKIQYQDHDLIQAYCQHIEIPYEEYIKLFNQTRLEPLAKLLEYDIFKDYERDFNPDEELEKVTKSKEFRDKTEAEKSAELGIRFIAYIHAIEKDKLYYFILAHEQVGKVLIVRTPTTDTEVEKQFLGYEWSKAKGREGIKYNGGETVDDIITPLFDPKDLGDDSKINTAIKRNFIGEITDLLPEHCRYAKLIDMLNFNRVKFNKTINLNPMQNIDFETQWPLVKLREVCSLQGGSTFKTIYQGNKDNTQIPFYKVSDMNSPENSKVMSVANNYVEESVFNQQIKATLIAKSSIIFPKVGMSVYTNKKRILGCDSGIDNNIMAVSVLDENKLIPLFLLEIFNQFISLGEIASIANPPSISEDNLREIKIPLLPYDKQKQIVDECAAIDLKTDKDRQTITAAKQQIEEKINRLWSECKKDKLDNVIWINTKTYNPTLKPDDEFVYIDIDSVGKASGVINFSQRLTGKNAPSRARRIAKNGNTIISTVRPYLKGFAFVDADNIDDCIFSTGFAVLESKSTHVLLDKVIYYFFMYMDELMQQMINTMDKSSYPSINEDDIKYYQFPVPPLDIQQQLIAEVKPLEERVVEAQAVIDNATERKNAILRKYLQMKTTELDC